MPSADLRRLVEAGRHREAFDALHAAHGAEIERFVRVRLGPGADAADVCQEVWAAVAQGLPGFRFESQPRVWLLSIARHKTMDRWRRHQAVVTLDSELEGGALGRLVGLRTVTTPSRDLDRRQRADALHVGLRALEPDDRELLELRFALGLKPGEIASMLGGVKSNTVSQRIVRAAQRLREALKGNELFAAS